MAVLYREGFKAARVSRPSESRNVRVTPIMATACVLLALAVALVAVLWRVVTFFNLHSMNPFIS
jgi:hypothetical protein